MNNLCDIIKILGVYFGGDAKKREELNFWKTLESIKKSINLWKWRGLSLIGRIQIVKTFAIPKLMFRASAISMSKDLVKEAESIFYHFIWNEKDKVKRNAVISEVENGGLNMLDTESMIRTKRVICLQKFLEDYESPWKIFLVELLKPVGGKFLLHWKRVYLLPFRTTLETKLREFQFKILNRIVFTNEKLFRFGMAESDKCSFCQTEVESIEHLIFSCKISSVFWKHVLSWLRDKNIVVENLKEEDIIFGKFDVGDDFLLVNHIFLLGKYYIHSQKCQKGIPSLQGFIAETRRVYNIELHIARKRSTLNKHLSKWEKLINIM